MRKPRRRKKCRARVEAIADLNLLLETIAAGDTCSVYLVSGDLVIAEPRAEKLARALADRAGCQVESWRRPAGLTSILRNLKTFSLFDAAKVTLVVDSAIFADRRTAAELIDQAEEALPVTELESAGREGASRLLQALRIFAIDPTAEPVEAIGSLPKWALEGGSAFRKKRSGRGRTAKQAATLRADLAKLLEAAHSIGLKGYAEGDLAELGEIAAGGLPEAYALVLAEHAVDTDHPVIKTLAAKGAFLDVGKVSAGRGGDWQGLRTLTDQLAKETSVAISPDAANELARRTLRQTGNWGKRGVDAESIARFAGEYRKLASLARGRHPEGGQAQRHPEGGQTHQISRKQVVESVDDRGEEDVWKILDAVGNGHGGEALARYRRLLAAADNAISTRLSFFGLLAGFCRHLTAVAGIAKLRGIPSGVRNYSQFKSRWVPRLQAELEIGKNPLAGLHPFRLHRAYLAASRMDRDLLARLPALVFETETRIKGESSEPDVAIAQLLARMTAAAKNG